MAIGEFPGQVKEQRLKEHLNGQMREVAGAVEELGSGSEQADGGVSMILGVHKKVDLTIAI
jgi:hypothetical protein